MQHYSLLDLAPVAQGDTITQALANARSLAQHAEKMGFHRYWLAEHHNMPGIASAATAVLIGHVAGATSTMRIGSGGIMLSNHAPLMIAEQFGTLQALYGDRIDLGLGRAPGTDGHTAQALRRHMDSADTFPNDVAELLGYLGDTPPPTGVNAFPGAGSNVPVWILGSSLFGAQFAAYMGLPYAFASHFAPQLLAQALHTYRTTFRPSRYLAKPYAIIAASVIAADTDDEADYLRSSQLQSFANVVTGKRGQIPAPVADIAAHVPPQVLAQVRHMLSVSAHGGPDKLHRDLARILTTYQPDELMVTSIFHNHAKRLHSLTLTANALQDLAIHAPA
ncbi:luciferase family oxidoreductase, group 1 [Pseudorhodobacter antarcticus]|jgi:luciferase family oxidoreductase group 1|uniref:Luciferase-like monooxygenase n=1 Tax=Pseudorhodobacter antarcticus TaxID=1077947 RepID=A0A1H8D8N1_9RHOB|nr:LLM class flavin-dependent oxidoreductase [Pseudorhodobacter antarcticus]SEN03194.1 luciferase family oxidoreductase, group 1 [Pseudorhodobacter antarcticus]